jgi:hypothetical protein
VAGRLDNLLKRMKQHSAATVNAEPALSCPVESRLFFCDSGNKNVRANRTCTSHEHQGEDLSFKVVA